MILPDLTPEQSRSRVLKRTQACAYLGLDPQLFRKLYRSGELPRSIRFSERVEGWRLGDLQDWIDQRITDQA